MVSLCPWPSPVLLDDTGASAVPDRANGGKGWVVAALLWLVPACTGAHVLSMRPVLLARPMALSMLVWIRSPRLPASNCGRVPISLASQEIVLAISSSGEKMSLHFSSETSIVNLIPYCNLL